MNKLKTAFTTTMGQFLHGNSEDLFTDEEFLKLKKNVNLILTSPPFPLNRKKKYGNLNGSDYIDWLTNITTQLRDFLTDDGSLVIEIGNSWEEKEPVMSTLPLETLLAIKSSGNYKLCQQFIWFNTAKLPSPVQWVNIDRSRVKDSYTTFWWLSRTSTPKANNKRVLEVYSNSMKKLLKKGAYNAGLRPSEHKIGDQSFLTNNGGAIPSNVLIGANTSSQSNYLKECKATGLIPHPARMPAFIVEFFIKFLTEENDLVLDPFAGSNTTGEISESLKRRWLSVEIDEKYIEGSKFKFNYDH